MNYFSTHSSFSSEIPCCPTCLMPAHGVFLHCLIGESDRSVTETPACTPWQIQAIGLTMYIGSWTNRGALGDDRHEGVLNGHLPHPGHVCTDAAGENAVVWWGAWRGDHIFPHIINHIRCSDFKTVGISSSGN